MGFGFTHAADFQPLPLCAGAAGGFMQVKTPKFGLSAHLAILTHPARALVYYSHMTEVESSLRTREVSAR